MDNYLSSMFGRPALFFGTRAWPQGAACLLEKKGGGSPFFCGFSALSVIHRRRRRQMSRLAFEVTEAVELLSRRLPLR